PLFLLHMERAKFMIAHNMDFDIKVLGAEMIRAGLKSNNKPHMVCTKVRGTNFARIPSPNGTGYKWPTLTELHFKLFGNAFVGAHDSLSDVDACAKCFFGLMDKGALMAA